MNELIKRLLADHSIDETYNLVLKNYNHVFMQSVYSDIWSIGMVTFCLFCIFLFFVYLLNYAMKKHEDYTPFVFFSIIMFALFSLSSYTTIDTIVSPNKNLMIQIQKQHEKIQKEQFTAKTGIEIN